MLFLGIDGGQSSTVALIGDESGRVLGHAVAGPCNHVGAAEGRAKFTRVINSVLDAACAAAGLDRANLEFEAASLGFSGGPADKQALIEEMMRIKRLEVTTDAHVALAGATGGQPGMIVIAGTGSIALGRGAAGRLARAGGWGYLFGDEGGAFYLVRMAVRAILQYEEGWGSETRLYPMMLEAVGAKSADEVMRRFYTADYPRSRVATFAPVVDAAARAGDAVAGQILHDAAVWLAGLITSVRERLFQPGEAALVCYIGGVFRSQSLLRDFCDRVELEAGNQCRPPLYGPAAGALLEAYRLAGLKAQLSELPEFKS